MSVGRSSGNANRPVHSIPAVLGAAAAGQAGLTTSYPQLPFPRQVSGVSHANTGEEGKRPHTSPFYLFQPPPLLFLLFNPLLPLSQQLTLILLLLPELLLLQKLLSPQSLRPLLVLLLQAQESTSQS